MRESCPAGTSVAPSGRVLRPWLLASPTVRLRVGHSSPSGSGCGGRCGPRGPRSVCSSCWQPRALAVPTPSLRPGLRGQACASTCWTLAGLDVVSPVGPAVLLWEEGHGSGQQWGSGEGSVSGQGAGAADGVSLLGLGLDRGCRVLGGGSAGPACCPRAVGLLLPVQVVLTRGSLGGGSVLCPHGPCLLCVRRPGSSSAGEEASSLLGGSWSSEETGGGRRSAGSPCARLSAPLMVVAADRPPEEPVSRAVGSSCLF